MQANKTGGTFSPWAERYCWKKSTALRAADQTPVASKPLKTRTGGAPIMARVDLNTLAPAFTLADFNGEPVSLADFTDQKNVLVVFNRGFL